MTIGAILDTLPKGYGGPTPDDLGWARHYIDTHPDFYRSKDTKVFAMQIRCLAYQRVAERRQASTPAPSADERLYAEVKRQRAITSELMGSSRNIFAGISLIDPDARDTACLRKVRSLGRNTSLLMLGTTGCGKTYAAVAKVGAVASFYDGPGGKTLNAQYVTAYDLAVLSGERASKVLEHYETAEYLIVDDLGAEPIRGVAGENFPAYFQDLFIQRHQNRRKTYITANLSREDVVLRYGQRFVSRFNEVGDLFETTDADLRAAV